MREDQVANAVTFLTHPKVQQATLEERLAFLRNKGLTEEEIEEAVKRADEKNAGNSATAGAAEGEGKPPVAPQPPIGFQPPPQQQQSSWATKVLVPGTLALSAGAGLAFLYKTMVLKQGAPQQWWGPFTPPPPAPNGAGQIPPNAPFPGHQQPGGMAPPELSHNTVDSRSHSLPGAPGAKDALVAQGKPLPDANAFALSHSSDSIVPLDTASMFGKAPYATAESMIWNGAGYGGSGVNEEMMTVLKQQGDVLKEVGNTMQTLLEQMNEMKTKGTSSTGDSSQSAWIATLSQAQSDMKSELNAIKTLLLTGNAPKDIASKLADLEGKLTSADAELTDKGSSSGTKAGLPLDNLLKAASGQAPKEESPEPQPTEPTNEEIAEKKIHESRSILTKLLESCPKEKLRPAINVLLMYFRNLVKEPQVPRYWRIARTNQSFNSSLGDVEHHLDFLRANGFYEKSQGYGANASRSPTLEWAEEWRENAENWSIAVLKDTIKNLEDASKSFTEQTTTKPTPSTTAVSQTNSEIATPAPPIKPVEKFTAQPFQMPNFDTSVKRPSPTPAVMPPAETDKKPEPPLHLTYSSPTPNPDTEETAEPSQNGTAANGINDARHPESFGDIVKMVSEGKTPPGVREIPNSLSVDASNPSASKLAPVPKPWEIVSTPQIADDIVEPVNESSTEFDESEYQPTDSFSAAIHSFQSNQAADNAAAAAAAAYVAENAHEEQYSSTT